MAKNDPLTDFSDALAILQKVMETHDLPLPNALMWDNPQDYARVVTTMRNGMRNRPNLASLNPGWNATDKVGAFELRRKPQDDWI